MVHLRKPKQNPAATAAAAAAVAAAIRTSSADQGIGTLNVAVAAAVAVHAAIPDEAPARAAEAASNAHATPAVCTAIAAGVAAAVDGFDFEATRNAAKAAFDAFSAYSNNPVVVEDLANEVAKNVKRVCTVYPAVEAAAAAAYASSLPNPPRRSALVNHDAIEAALSAVAATKSFGGSGISSYRATAAARAATFRKESRRSSGAAALGAPTPTGTCRASAHWFAYIIADASSSFGMAVACSGRAYDVEQLEALSDEHNRTYQRLQTIITLDTFLAGFLLNSLTERPEEGDVSYEEATSILLEVMSFGILLGVTVFAGTLMVVTGDRYALSKGDLKIPVRLSTMGHSLLIATVALSSSNALGLTSNGYTAHHNWFVVGYISLLAPSVWVCIVLRKAIRREFGFRFTFLSHISVPCR